MLANILLSITMIFSSINPAVTTADITNEFDKNCQNQNIEICQTIYEDNETGKMRKMNVFDFVTDDLIKIYEKKIVKKTVISNIPATKIKRMAKFYKIPENKYKGLLMIQSIAKENGNLVTMEKLLQMDHKNLMKFAKIQFDKKMSCFTEKERKQIMAELKCMYEKFLKNQAQMKK